MLWIYGRCRSGTRWFWAATCYDWHAGADEETLEHGWAESEDGAVHMARRVIEPRTGDRLALAYIRQSIASRAPKQVNAVKRSARAPKPGTVEPAPVEYLYEPWSWTDYDNPPYETLRGIRQIPVIKKTARRIYFDNTSRWDRRDAVITLGYIDRQEFEADTRNCHRGTLAGATTLPSSSQHGGGTVYANREAAEEYLFAHLRTQERKRQEAEPDLRRLRMEMADAHPDRGGTNEGFIAARKRYKEALRRAS